jgi:hypothetical protein
LNIGYVLNIEYRLNISYGLNILLNRVYGANCPPPSLSVIPSEAEGFAVLLRT